LLETIPMDKREEIIRLLNEPMNNLEKLKNKVNELNIKTFLIHLFTLSFLYVVAFEVSIFALEYYGLYKMNLLTGGVSTIHWDYILLSQRGMFSTDYGMFESLTQWFKALRILQSFIGISLFTVLVTSFSTISAEKGISRKQEFLLYLEETVCKLKTLEQEVSKTINNAA
jgi:ABC-type multidrug transport system fused ATPase/permease subunit